MPCPGFARAVNLPIGMSLRKQIVKPFLEVIMKYLKDFVFIIQLLVGCFCVYCIFKDAIILGFAAMYVVFILGFLSDRFISPN